MSTRQPSCVSERSIPPAAYQVLSLVFSLGREGVTPSYPGPEGGIPQSCPVMVPWLAENVVPPGKDMGSVELLWDADKVTPPPRKRHGTSGSITRWRWGTPSTIWDWGFPVPLKRTCSPTSSVCNFVWACVWEFWIQSDVNLTALTVKLTSDCIQNSQTQALTIYKM